MHSSAGVVLGLVVVLLVQSLDLQKEMVLLGALLAAYGLLSAPAIMMAKRSRTANMLSCIVGDFSGMPDVMNRLALVQIFWIA